MTVLPRRWLLRTGLALAMPAILRARQAGAAGTAMPYPAWLDAWAGVLQRRVDARVRVDFAGIAADPGPLEAVVASVAAQGPQNDPRAFPTRADVIAYHLNAYNATAMLGIVRRGIPDYLGLIARFAFFANTTVRIGGTDTTLKEYENDVIRPLGEERVHFCLNCMVRGCPRLPRVPFRAGVLEAQLSAAAREFCSSPYQVRPAPDRGRVYVSQIFEFYTSDFTPAKAPSLLAYVNRWRASTLPDDWRVGFFDYDWTVNRQPAR
ncbi:DUF547 domain-containing protein [Acidisphaera rubrifaciens]|uniref:DUF547 domain-containing protein n=1 Tax=Acidisphaera rubrifaciens HS-AP3 TaxID=1231350 RepID=A0A0D6P7M2_9PROT|nr:DUF547 domain-containing protein [Acidisphaera rubrifaciens]GAN77760.1 hypothetical protein Asru_0450_02 [Acidisphaera rubrifaciens HS-AP3]